jgi:beta-galactosidase
VAILKRLVAEVKRLDPSRHTCVGGVIHLDHPYHDITSVIGIHYQGLVNSIEKVTGYFPSKPHIQDECGLHAPTRGVYKTQPGRNSEFSTISGLMPSFANMTKVPAVGSGDLRARDNISTILTDVFLDSTTTGGCIWTGMDYHGEPVPTAWPSVISAYGARDLLGLPKDFTGSYGASSDATSFSSTRSRTGRGRTAKVNGFHFACTRIAIPSRSW